MHYRTAFDKLINLITPLKPQLDPLTFMRLTDLMELIPTKLQDDLILIQEINHFHKTWKGNERRARYNRVRRGGDPSIRSQIARGLTPEQKIEALVRDGTPPSTNRNVDQPVRDPRIPQSPPIIGGRPDIDLEANTLFAEDDAKAAAAQNYIHTDTQAQANEAERDAGYGSMFSNSKSKPT